jgi:hypothetical protein
VPEDARSTRPARLTRTGERLAGYVYGTIIVLSVIVASARTTSHGTGHIAALVLVTAVILWLAHVYAHALGDSVGREQHLSLGELADIAYHESSIVTAALPPVLVLFLGHLGVLADTTAIWLALGIGLAVLAAQGVRFARIERLGLLGTVAVVAVNLGLGVLLIALKLLVTHH